MRIRPLVSATNPTGPSWRTPEMTHAELKELRKRLALIIGYNTATGKIQPVGSGFIVGTLPAFYIVTAAHVLSGFVNALLGPAPRTAFSEAGNDADAEIRRVAKVIKDGKIKAVIEHYDRDEALVIDLIATNIDGDERMNDMAILRAARHDQFFSGEFRAMVMDFAPIDFAENHVMAGFAQMPSLQFDEESRVAEMRKKIVIRAAPVVEQSTNAEGARPGALLWRVPMPSEPGMSGGPLLRLRHPQGSPSSLPDGHTILETFTAVGVVSRGRASESLVESQRKAGYTWITPIEMIKYRPLDNFPFAINIDMQLVTYQDVEVYLASLQPRQAANCSIELLPLLRKKMIRSTAPVVDAYVVALSEMKSPLGDSSTLPYPKRLIEELMRIAIAATQNRVVRRRLIDAYQALANWQESAELERNDIQELVDAEAAQLAQKLQESGVPH
jgi:hypothetical protein